MRSHISYKGETILKMNEKGDKAKSLAASGSSQNIAKTLKMFRDMDAKEQAPPVPQAKLKPGLINEKSELKIEHKELNDGKNQQIKGAKERILEMNANSNISGRGLAFNGEKNNVKDKVRLQNEFTNKSAPGTLKNEPNKVSHSSDHDNNKDSSKVLRSSSMKKFVSKYQDKLSVDTSSSGNNSVTKRHSTGPVGQIRNSFQADFMNKVNIGLLKQMQSRGSEEKTIDAFKSVIHSSIDKQNEKAIKDVKKAITSSEKQAETKSYSVFKDSSSSGNNVQGLDLDVVADHEKLIHPTITRARPSKNSRPRRPPSRYSKIMNS